MSDSPAQPPLDLPSGATPPHVDSMAVFSLVLGLAAFPGICCFGVPAAALGATAFTLGRMSRRRILGSSGTLTGFGVAEAGAGAGLVAGSMGLLYMLYWVASFLFSVISGYYGVAPTPTPR